MKVKYLKSHIEIVPECDQDEVYLEAILGLRGKGDTAMAERVAAAGLDNVFSCVKIYKAVKEGSMVDAAN